MLLLLAFIIQVHDQSGVRQSRHLRRQCSDSCGIQLVSLMDKLVIFACQTYSMPFCQGPSTWADCLRFVAATATVWDNRSKSYHFCGSSWQNLRWISEFYMENWRSITTMRTVCKCTMFHKRFPQHNGRTSDYCGHCLITALSTWSM